ncbi:MAG: hypothetical protein O3B86_05040 [Planctomycetota bacterium]|nr:hypothetical protein [Planctomycetota bacterium]
MTGRISTIVLSEMIANLTLCQQTDVSLAQVLSENSCLDGNLMAKCDEGYICDICGGAVDEIVDSDLYLRFVIGQAQESELTKSAERHIRCNPVQAQFIVHEDFEAVIVEGPFDKRLLDPEHVRQQEDLITRGWLRIREVTGAGLPVSEYPLKPPLKLDMSKLAANRERAKSESETEG